MAGMPNLKVVVFPAPDIKIGFYPPDPMDGQLSVNVSSQPDIRVTLTQPQVQSFVSGIPFFTFADSAISSSYALFATTSSYASVSNYALNAFPYTGSAHITGSLSITGSAYFTNRLVIGPANLSGSSQSLLNIGTSVSGSIFFVTGSGRVGINTIDPLYELHVVGTIFSTVNIVSLSDARYKENVYPIYDPLGLIRRVQGVRYTMKRKNTDTGPMPTNIGFLAQDLKQVLPELVLGDDQMGYSVAYGNMVALLAEGIKELDTRVQILESK